MINNGKTRDLDFNVYLEDSSRQLVAGNSDLYARGPRSVPRERGYLQREVVH
jgi:hypothetical protein